MKLRLLLLLAATSAGLFAVGRAEPARRPRYGGMLRVEIGATVNSIDPSVAAASSEEAAARDEICSAINERRRPEGAFAANAASGPFRVAEWEPGKRLMLEANPSYREGRPFVDSVEIQMGKSSRDRLLDLEVEKTDIAEIPAEEVRRASEAGVRIAVSQPDQLIALVFVPGRAISENAHSREALSRSVNRSAIVNFILQKEGEPAGGLLPQWSGGTAFLFSTAVDAVAARNLWAEVSGLPKILLGYDASDSLEQSLAERIAVDARAAGGLVTAVAIHAGADGGEDVRIVRLGMASPDPREALARLVAVLGPMAGSPGETLSAAATPQQVYETERAVLNTYRIVPLVWMPRVYGLGARVRDWKTPKAGEGWPFADVWLGDAQ